MKIRSRVLIAITKHTYWALQPRQYIQTNKVGNTDLPCLLLLVCCLLTGISNTLHRSKRRVAWVREVRRLISVPCTWEQVSSLLACNESRISLFDGGNNMQFPCNADSYPCNILFRFIGRCGGGGRGIVVIFAADCNICVDSFGKEEITSTVLGMLRSKMTCHC
jgi:hypothetical protein